MKTLGQMLHEIQSPGCPWEDESRYSQAEIENEAARFAIAIDEKAWRPMSEAPKDDHILIVLGEGESECVCEAWWWEDENAWCIGDNTFVPTEEIRCFRPLPAPPKGETNG